MFARFRAWVASQRQWKRDHLATWAGWTDAEPGGLSKFQLEAESAVEAALREANANLTGREVHPLSDGAYLYAVISPVGVDLWLHSDTVEVGKDKAYRRLEEWDFRTPQEMIDEAVRVVRGVLHERSFGAA